MIRSLVTRMRICPEPGNWRLLTEECYGNSADKSWPNPSRAMVCGGVLQSNNMSRAGVAGHPPMRLPGGRLDMFDHLIDHCRPALIEAHFLVRLAAGLVAVDRNRGVSRARALGFEEERGGEERLG